MPRDRAEIVASLSTKGFELRQHKRDHDYFFFKHPHRTQPVYTKISRGNEYRTVGDSLIGKMSRQLHLTRAQFDSLIDCGMQKPDYVTVLVLKGILRQPPKKP